MKKYFLAIASDGTVFKRSSEGRSYSHCVAVYASSRAYTFQGRSYEAREGWEMRGQGKPQGEWASRLDLAQKNAASKKGWDTPHSNCKIERVEILQAVEVDARAFKAGVISAEDQRVADIKSGKISEGPEELAKLLPRLG